MKAYEERYRHWLNGGYDEKTRAELRAITNEAEIEDRFCRDISFGTGGIRGIMAAGTNRMNAYTVARATRGLASYLKSADRNAAEKGVVIAYDTRWNSREYADVAARILTNAGIRAQVFREPVPTPVLSFAVAYLGCSAGVVITASHNTREYNGYKVYDEKGCQLVPEKAAIVARHIGEAGDTPEIPEVAAKAYLIMLGPEVADASTAAVLRQSRLSDVSAKAALGIVYTPLHGTGLGPVTRTLSRDGFSNVTVVSEQAGGDGDFPTVRTPNPEDEAALRLAVKTAEEHSADIVLGTDPDTDRLGVCVWTENGYQRLTGNQVGILLVKFLLEDCAGTSGTKPVVVKTVVTGELGAEIARANGAEVWETLTGFKYIGDRVSVLEDSGGAKGLSFLLGFEESCGYLVGDHARDKDAVSAAMLLCEMAAFYKSRFGKTLVQVLDVLYMRYGFSLDVLEKIQLSGTAGMEQIGEIMEELRHGPAVFRENAELMDYSTGLGGLPRENMLKYRFEDGSWIAVRPSGTEPALKIYYSIRRSTESRARAELDRCREALSDRIAAIR